MPSRSCCWAPLPPWSCGLAARDVLPGLRGSSSSACAGAPDRRGARGARGRGPRPDARRPQRAPPAARRARGDGRRPRAAGDGRLQRAAPPQRGVPRRPRPRQLLEATNARRRARGLPERTRGEVEREFGGRGGPSADRPAMARCLIIGCGCRGLALAASCATAGTRSAGRRATRPGAELEAAGPSRRRRPRPDRDPGAGAGPCRGRCRAARHGDGRAGTAGRAARHAAGDVDERTLDRPSGDRLRARGSVDPALLRRGRAGTRGLRGLDDPVRAAGRRPARPPGLAGRGERAVDRSCG